MRFSIVSPQGTADKTKWIDEASCFISSSSPPKRFLNAREKYIALKKEQMIEHSPHADAGVRRPQIDPDRWSF
jgi:hypothetical protein